jgi:pimeloyl-ACP methyl ester carboxylesterase
VSETLTISSGKVEYHKFGEDGGRRVLCFHGTPGSVRTFSLYSEVASECGLQLIAVSRPGYGASTNVKWGHEADWCRNLANALCDAGLRPDFVLGVSGGGVWAAMTARCIPSAHVCLVSAFAPGLDGAGREMIEINRLMLTVMSKAPRLGSCLGLIIILLGRLAPGVFLKFGSRRTMPEVDFNTLIRPAIYSNYVDLSRSFTASDGFAFARDFRLLGILEPPMLKIDAPTLIVQGDRDVNVPPSHVEYWSMRAPIHTIRLFADEGHTVLMNRAESIFRELASPSDN